MTYLFGGRGYERVGRGLIRLVGVVWKGAWLTWRAGTSGRAPHRGDSARRQLCSIPSAQGLPIPALLGPSARLFPEVSPAPAPRGSGGTRGTRAVPSGGVPGAGSSRTGHPSDPGAPELPAERPMAVPRQVGGGSTSSGTWGGLCHSCHCGLQGHGASNAPRAGTPCTPQPPGPCVGLRAPPTPRDGCRPFLAALCCFLGTSLLEHCQYHAWHTEREVGQQHLCK